MNSDEAEKLAKDIKNKYNLSHKCSVNLEDTINNMIDYGLSIKKIEGILLDIFENIEFLE